MYEVKVYIIHGNLTIPVTIASFDIVAIGSPVIARSRAINFAKLVIEGFAVDVIEVANEDNPISGFGLVYHRDARF